MDLTSQFSSHFDSTIRQRGAEYYRGGRVVIDRASPRQILATVRGTIPYRVTIERDEGGARVACTCPFFGAQLCKHIWAVVMAIAARHLWQGDGVGRVVHDASENPGVPENPRVKENPGVIDASFEDEDLPLSSLPNSFNAEDFDAPHMAPQRGATPRRKPPQQGPAHWRSELAQLEAKSAASRSVPADAWPAQRELLYVLDVQQTLDGAGIYIEVLHRDRKKDGSWTRPKFQALRREQLLQLPDPIDRHILAHLGGAPSLYASGWSANGFDAASHFGAPCRYRLVAPQLDLLLPLMLQSGRGRLRLRPEDADLDWLTLEWEEGEPYQLRLQVRRADADQPYELTGVLTRAAERMALSEPVLLVEDGLLFTRDRVARYAHHGAFYWIELLRQHSPLLVPAEQIDDCLAELLRQRALPPLDWPSDLAIEETVSTPRPRLTLKPDTSGWRLSTLLGELSFDYEGMVIDHHEPGRGLFLKAHRRVILRDTTAEVAASNRLLEVGLRRSPWTAMNPKPAYELRAKHLPGIIRVLSAEGWYLEAEGKIYRPPGRFDMQVKSGIDWFELHGALNFGETEAQLPELLASVRRGEGFVKLSDGSLGVLPEEWLERYGLLASLGAAQADHLRFKRSQVGLLDALLAAEPKAECDTLFEEARNELRGFSGIEAAEPPAGFVGQLRPYQKEGLGWLHFLRRFGFGGCLADDMGLGKTVQVLALLEARRESRSAQRNNVGPSLVVVPKSLIFNWQQEAARFTPLLRLLDHTGVFRRKGSAHFEDYDVVLTTYGTLRKDAVDFRDVRFDYVILDEAQAIKNAGSESAKAARLLNADHRLAVTGTPVENHLGELWSLFEFLNPGMLGAASLFKSSQGALSSPDEATRRVLSQALRPFLLRRTKEQVDSDLPPKLEQALYCELEAPQRKRYNEMRDFYRQTLLGKAGESANGQFKMQVLEALLRLRQAALHPGLLDARYVGEASAKLDMLLPQLREVLDEGHKALVFSQFTRMLGILRTHLDEENVPYAYLDGKTPDRQACVERFQTDPDCKLFLVSLKAGGVGLNLTAAQYVFLLDPWWNPAVEAQAIDRAHRIGQTRHVFAYRLIARDTVEEKVLQLQSTKRDLADAILTADNALIRDLTREDLDILLS